MNNNLTPYPKEIKRDLYIDSLRGVAIILVLGTHGCSLLNVLFPFLSLEKLNNLLSSGYYGVVIFFTLSGFLITRNTLQRYGRISKIKMYEFYSMRIGRIFPPLLLFITIMFLLGYFQIGKFTPPNLSMLVGAVYNAIIFQYNNYYFQANVPGMIHWSPLWSLSIEETFYLLYPIACILSRRTIIFILLLLSLIIFGPFAREKFWIFSWLGCADLISIGCLTAILNHKFVTFTKNNYINTSLRLIGMFSIIILLLNYDAKKNLIYIPTILSLATALFLLGSNFSSSLHCLWAPWKLIIKILESFGKLSYEIYLFHIAIILAFAHLIHNCILFLNANSNMILFLFKSSLLLLIFIICKIISKFFSEPLNKMIRSILNHTLIEKKEIVKNYDQLIKDPTN